MMMTEKFLFESSIWTWKSFHPDRFVAFIMHLQKINVNGFERISTQFEHGEEIFTIEKG